VIVPEAAKGLQSDESAFSPVRAASIFPRQASRRKDAPMPTDLDQLFMLLWRDFERTSLLIRLAWNQIVRKRIARKIKR
jgi:hypothetical protein